MQIHQLKPEHKSKDKKRIGRGGKHGTYSGKGMKGQKSRAGRKMPPIIREIIKRYPKLRGYRQKLRIKEILSVNLSVLEKKFENGEKITPSVLLNKKIIRRIKGKTPSVKIIGEKEISKKLMIENCQVSKGAKEKIEKVGGSIK